LLFCIGTTPIDLDACKKKGVVVLMPLYSELTRFGVELAIGEIISLLIEALFPVVTESTMVNV